MRITKHKSFSFGKYSFINKSKVAFEKSYELLKELGSGSYGRVYRVKNIISNEIRACKKIIKEKIDDIEGFNKEIDILSKLDHPNIIKLYEIFEEQRFIYLIMEECTGGELFERIIDNVNNKNMYTEKETADIFKQIMSAICYCHAQQICHRDLKPENILFSTTERNSLIKVIDFGLSKQYMQNPKGKKKMQTKVGTPYYISPEVLKGDYNEKCDNWSAGVILYLMLSGIPPFNGNTDLEIFRSIEKKKYSFPEEEWKDISKEAKDLISKMLCEASVRLPASKVLEHKWIVNSSSNPVAQLSNMNVKALMEYTQNHKLKKVVLTFIASRLKEEEISNLKDYFFILDKNKNGTISLQELKIGLSKIQGNDEIKAEKLISAIDSTHSGNINYTEFIASLIDNQIYLKEERLEEAFRLFDTDNNGKISKDEIKKVLKVDSVNDKDIEKLIKELDYNGDGEIDYNEFCAMMK